MIISWSGTPRNMVVLKCYMCRRIISGDLILCFTTSEYLKYLLYFIVIVIDFLIQSFPDVSFNLNYFFSIVAVILLLLKKWQIVCLKAIFIFIFKCEDFEWLWWCPDNGSYKIIWNEIYFSAYVHEWCIFISH